MCKALGWLPPELPVTVAIEQELCVLDRTGDRISGYYSGAMDISGVTVAQAFSLGRGRYPVVALQTADEI